MKKTSILTYFFLIAWQISCSAQYWEQIIGSPDSRTIFYNVVILPNQDIITVGIQGTPSGIVLTRIDSQGNTVWENIIDDPSANLENRPAALILNPIDNGLYIVSNRRVSSSDLSLATIWEINSDGTLAEQYNGLTEGYSIAAAVFNDFGELFVAGTLELNGNDAFCAKVNLDGANASFDWEHTYGGDNIDELEDLTILTNGKLAAAGYTSSFGQGDFDALLMLLDQDGSNTEEITFGDSLPNLSYALAEYNQEIFLAGTRNNGLEPINIQIFKTDISGQKLNTFNESSPAAKTPRSMAISVDGNIWLTGQYSLGLDPGQLFLKQYDVNGLPIFERQFGGILNDTGLDLELFSNGSAVAVGAFVPSSNNFQGYIIKASPLGETYSSGIKGNVFWDIDQDCILNNEEGLSQWPVLIEGDLSRWTLTDDLGNYQVQLDTGDYNITVFPPNDYWSPCNFTTDFSIANSTDSICLDLGIQAAIDCPLLKVNIGTPFLRRCFENTYYVEVCNEGTISAEDASIEIDLDPFLSYISSSIPLNAQNGNLLEFIVGDLALQDCVNFNFTVLVDCDSTVIGQTHCVSARAFPDSICNPINSDWDQSSLELDAVCLGDSIQFIFTNVGTGATSQPLGYVIIEDDIMLFQGDVDLFPLEDTVITLPSNGGTWVLQSEQPIGHPGIDDPTIVIEGCGGFPFSLGYVIQYPHNDANAFIDIDCRENNGSFDPNDKLAFPLGYADEHYIENEEEIEYLIRFQNTGTDTAFTVAILDTLDVNLDLSTFKFGSSSHPSRVSISEENKLEFYFDNILLPDSTTNESASHGFVKFKISPKENLEEGTMIYNQAGIYFDFNEPVITNQTYHTIGIDYIIIDLVDEIKNPSNISEIASYYPNPFLEHIYFELKNAPQRELTFQVFNLQGQLIHQQKIKDNRFSYRHIDRSSGVYFFQILSEGTAVSTGKIIHQN